MHPVINIARSKLGGFGRINCSVNSLLIHIDPDDDQKKENKYDNKQVQIHAMLESSAIYVKVCKRIVWMSGKEKGKEILVEEWIPEEHYKFFPEGEGTVEEGTVWFATAQEPWREYPPDEVYRIKGKLEDLQYLILKSKTRETYE